MVTTVRISRPEKPNRLERHHGSGLVGSPDSALDSVVVPLDGTECAEHAIPLAVAIARRSGAAVKLIRGFTPAEGWGLRPGSGAFRAAEGSFRADARGYLDRIRRRITGRVKNLKLTTHFAEAPSVIEAIGKASMSADLVVMASHRRGWFGRFLFGSFAHDLLMTHKRPVMFVRGYDSPVDLSGDPIPRHLAIGLDGRKSSERALEMAGRIARLAKARTTLLHVNDPSEFDERFAHSSPEGYLRWTGRNLSETVPRVATHVVRNAASPIAGILSFAEEAEADVIAVTSDPSRPSFRSTAEKLIRSSPVPVLVVPE